MKPSNLSLKWRQRADDLGRYAPYVAQAIRDCADELDIAITEWQLEALTLEQAADESGYSYGGLQRLVAEGKLENVGEEGAPRVRRGDLPRKPSPPSNGQPDPIGQILARRAAG